MEAVSRGTERGDRHGREWRGEEVARPGSSGAVEGMDLTCGARVLVAGREKAVWWKTQLRIASVFQGVRQGPSG
jgi:hypothetical protein